MTKLVLGTVQFGLNYGINNTNGKVHASKAAEILSFAYQNGINMLDTSYAYGNSELILGELLSSSKNEFQIITKIPTTDLETFEIFTHSLQRLNQSEIYGYLIHHFSFFQYKPQVWNDLKELKNQGKVKKIGFSLYNPNELKFLMENDIDFDLLQIPYNIFDRSFEPYFDELKKRNTEIHVRSVFLQGLFFMDPEKLPIKLLPLKTALKEINSFCINHNHKIEELALGYVYQNPNIDGVLIGLDNIDQLKSNVNSIKVGLKKVDSDYVSTIQIKNKELLNPVNWK